MAVIVTFGIIDPPASLTVPVIVPRSVCAKALPEQSDEKESRFHSRCPFLRRKDYPTARPGPCVLLSIPNSQKT